jgi:hypothetical protein
MRPLAVLYTIAAFICGASAFAQSYPDRPIRWVVTFPPSGPTDAIGSTSAELEIFMRVETERWKKVIGSAGIKAE